MIEFFGGTGITFEKLKKVMPTVNIDGTTYKIEDWLKECALFNRLVPGKTPVWVPYGGAQDFGILESVVWDKYEFKHYIDETGKLKGHPIECKDWWFSEPYLRVRFAGGVWYVYEISYYKKIRRKTQLNHLDRIRARGKGKFLDKRDIAALKRMESIENSIRKRNANH